MDDAQVRRPTKHDEKDSRPPVSHSLSPTPEAQLTPRCCRRLFLPVPHQEGYATSIITTISSAGQTRQRKHDTHTQQAHGRRSATERETTHSTSTRSIVGTVGEVPVWLLNRPHPAFLRPLVCVSPLVRPFSSVSPVKPPPRR